MYFDCAKDINYKYCKQYSDFFFTNIQKMLHLKRCITLGIGKLFQ